AGSGAGPTSGAARASFGRPARTGSSWRARPPRPPNAGAIASRVGRSAHRSPCSPALILCHGLATWVGSSRRSAVVRPAPLVLAFAMEVGGPRAAPDVEAVRPLRPLRVLVAGGDERYVRATAFLLGRCGYDTRRVRHARPLADDARLRATDI